MGIFSKLKSIYTSVDKAIGGVLPGGAPSVFRSTKTTKEIAPTTVSKPSPSTPAPAPPTSGRRRVSPGSVGIRTSSGSYNPITKVYTDPFGRDTSTLTPPPGTAITLVPSIATVRARSRATSGVLRPFAQSTLSTPISKSVIDKVAKQIQQTGIIKRAGSIFNTISGGVLTRKDIRKQQAKLNTDIEEFNRRFGNKELEEKSYAKAQAKFIELQTTEKALEIAQQKAEGKPLKKIWDLVLGDGALFMNYDFEKVRTTAKKDLKKFETQRSKTTSSFNKKRLDLLIKAKKEDITRIENKQLPRVHATAVPISPVGIAGIPKNLKVKFLGTQKQVGSKIITDLRFSSSKGDIGVAKGVTLIKGKKGYSLVGGRFGKPGLKFPLGKPTVKRIKSFVGVEQAVTKPTTLEITKQLNLIKGAKSSGQIIKVTRNIKLLKQAGVGRIATVKGQKLLKTGVRFPSGKLIKVKPTSLNLDNFASISAILRKKDLSAIIGRTITAKGSKAKFIGLIKGIRGTPKTFRVGGAKELKQYQQALTKVMGAVSGALLQTKKISGLTKGQRLALATNIIKSTPIKIAKLPSIKTKAVTKLATKQVPTTRGATALTQPRDSHGRFIPLTKTITRTRQGISTKIKQAAKVIQRATTTQKAKLKAMQKTKQVTKQKATQLSTQRLRQLQKQRLAQKTLQRTLQRTVLKTKIPSRITGGRFALRPLPLAIRRSLQTTLPKLKKGNKIGYLIYEKVRGRYKKVKVNALSLKDAKDKLAKRLDNRLSRTARLVKVKVKKLGSIRKKEVGYYNRFKKNLRNYKIVKGRKIRTPLTYIEKKGSPVISTRGEKKQLARERSRAIPKSKAAKRTKRSKGYSAKTQKRDSHGRFISLKRKR